MEQLPRLHGFFPFFQHALGLGVVVVASVKPVCPITHSAQDETSTV